MLPIDPGTAVTLSKEALGLLAQIQKLGAKRKEKFSAAIRALFDATRETQIYVARNAADLLTEARLAELWHSAAIEWMRFDGKLASRLHLKGTYWTEPSAWTDEQVKGHRITLAEMYEICRQLLHEKT